MLNQARKLNRTSLAKRFNKTEHQEILVEKKIYIVRYKLFSGNRGGLLVGGSSAIDEYPTQRVVESL